MITEVRYKELISICNAARPLYMQGKETGISDETYDQYMNDIYEYEKSNPVAENSPTKSVNPADNGDVKHPFPMLSLRDIFSIEEACSFLHKVDSDVEVIQEYKLDGLSVQLIYEGGQLVSASTRGNGYVGVECLEAAKQIEDIPKTIISSRRLVVHGEVFMKKSRFEEYCEWYGKQANPRNTAVGIFKRKTELGRARYLSFMAFNLDNAAISYQQADDNDFYCTITADYSLSPLDYHTECLDELERLGFPVVPHWEVQTDAHVQKLIAEVKEHREDLDIPIDGMVLKANDLAYREKVGDNGVIPAWAVAYKFPAKEQETKLLRIEFQVGSTGKITPVAILEPVPVDGSTISRCTLHNRQRIELLDVKINDMVTVYKSGDIIPAIKSTRHTDESVDVVFPIQCPSCNSELVNDCCVNKDCGEKLKARLLTWVAKDVANFKGVSDSLVETLFSRGDVRYPEDFYTKATPRVLSSIPKVGSSKIAAFFKGIKESKEKMTFIQLAVGLGVDGLSWAGAKALDTFYSSDLDRVQKLEKLLSLTEDELIRVLGKAKGKSVYRQLHEDDFYESRIKGICQVFRA